MQPQMCKGLLASCTAQYAAAPSNCHHAHAQNVHVCCSPRQVERLSGLVDQATATLELNDELRLQCINSSAAINKRMRQFSEMCEGELYGKLQSSNPQIAVYHG